MFLDELKKEANYTLTENGAKTHLSSQNYCLDLFATIGALRYADDEEVMDRFFKAFAENREMAMKILFYARDIRGGLGERKVFRTILKELAMREPDTVKKNLWLVSEYGRWDDLLCLLDGNCEKEAMSILVDQFRQDCRKYNSGDKEGISLLAKWLPSVNTSSKGRARSSPGQRRFSKDFPDGDQRRDGSDGIHEECHSDGSVCACSGIKERRD